MTQCRQLAAAGRPEEAAALVERAAERGDGEAAFILANWRLWGIQGEHDLAAGHHWLDRARRAGHAEANRLKAALLGNGTGCSADLVAGRALLEEAADRDPEARRQLEVLRTSHDRTAAREHPLSTDPSVRLIEKAFTRTECAYLIEKAGPALRPSMVRNPATGQGMLDPIRRSSGMYFDPSIEDLVVRSINLRLAALSGTSVECGEMLHVLRYGPSDEYRAHIDARPGADNQRHVTALVYLNDDYTGGETQFVNLDLKVRGRTGDCLIFVNADAQGRADERMRHAGLPVQSGVKWLATRWIRQRPHDPTREA